MLQERVDSLQRALSLVKQEESERTGHFSSLERDVRERDLAARNSEQQYKSFKETLASLLTNSYHSVEPYEESIRDRINQLVLHAKDKSSVRFNDSSSVI